MIIDAATPDGAKAKVYLKDGTLCELPIARYNTETKVAMVYEIDDATGRVKLTEWEADGDNKMRRTPIIKAVILEGSYVEIDGKRV